MQTWDEAQRFEEKWWDTCADTLGEEIKQLGYIHCMGLTEKYGTRRTNPRLNFEDKVVADFGSGPVSILLKSTARTRIAIDPIRFPEWVYARYVYCGIKPIVAKAEDVKLPTTADIGLIYNVLLHVEDPKKVVDNIHAQCKEIYVFEWANTNPSPGHPHTFTKEQLDELFGGKGEMKKFNGENGLFGWGYFGKFTGNVK
jgi:hypothetical protein